MKLYLGNLAYHVTKDDIIDLLGSFGEVDDVSIPIDKISGLPRGFAIVEMPDDSAGQNAIKSLNDKPFNDRTLVIEEARK